MSMLSWKMTGDLGAQSQFLIINRCDEKRPSIFELFTTIVGFKAVLYYSYHLPLHPFLLNFNIVLKNYQLLL